MDGRIIRAGFHSELEPHPFFGFRDDGTFSPSITGREPVELTREVSVVIPTFHNRQLKRQCLRHTLAGISASECVREMILVLSQNEEEPLSFLTENLGSLPIKLVKGRPNNRGQTRNLGAAQASSEYLLFLDDDMVLKNWRMIDVIISKMAGGKYECALFPRRQYARFPLLYEAHGLDAFIAAWKGDNVGEKRSQLYDPIAEGANHPSLLICFPGCFTIIRRECFTATGGFVQAFEGWGFEDTEFGIRAMRRMRTLNLFARSEQLLHIDHPVSPSKADDHQANYRRFFSLSDAIDLNSFCLAVFEGGDFPGKMRKQLEKSRYLLPLQKAKLAGKIPLNIEEVRPWCFQLAKRRVDSYLDPLPQFVVLHGSRASGGWTDQSDFDVLCLFRGGFTQDFYVSQAGVPQVEIECADLNLFTNIAKQPWLSPFLGPLEMAKIAQARLLWGDRDFWEKWSSDVLQKAIVNGRLVWNLFLLGAHLNADKYGLMLPRCLRAMATLLNGSSNPVFQPEHDRLLNFDRDDFAKHLTSVLDCEYVDWRVMAREGRKLFEVQAPEIWRALSWLLQDRRS